MSGRVDLAPDWRIERSLTRMQVRNSDGYVADLNIRTNPETSARNEAAAYAIRAVPELLEACTLARDIVVAVVEFRPELYRGSETLAKLDAALAKARGES